MQRIWDNQAPEITNYETVYDELTKINLIKRFIFQALTR